MTMIGSRWFAAASVVDSAARCPRIDRSMWPANARHARCPRRSAASFCQNL